MEKKIVLVINITNYGIIKGLEKAVINDIIKSKIGAAKYHIRDKFTKDKISTIKDATR